MKTQNIPNWKKGDIICLLNNNGGVISVFEANQDPWLGMNIMVVQGLQDRINELEKK